MDLVICRNCFPLPSVVGGLSLLALKLYRFQLNLKVRLIRLLLSLFNRVD